MKEQYIGPDTQTGTFIAHNPLGMLCIDLTKVNPSKDSTENVLVPTDTFSKFSQNFVTYIQKAVTIAKELGDKWF